MSNYDFRFDQPELTEAQTGKYKDFDSLYRNFEAGTMQPKVKVRTLKIPLMLAAAASLVLVAGLWYYGQQTHEQNLVADRMIQPPLENVDVQFTSYTVNAASGAELSYPTGSTLNIPPDAFVDEQGQPIKGQVNVQYRELHNPIDFFAAGIPTDLSYASGNGNMNSAGMVEIKATSDAGQQVFMNPAQPIQVDMASAQDGDSYTLFYFDENKKQWVPKGKIQTNPIYAKSGNPVSKDSLWQLVASQIPQPEYVLPPKPEKPRKASKDRYLFDIDILDEEFPELKAYKDVTFEVGPGQSFDVSLYDVEWEDIALTKLEQKYLLTLFKADKTYQFEVSPVIEEKNYAAAMLTYNQQAQSYEVALANKEAALQQYQATIAQKVAEMMQQATGVPPTQSTSGDFVPRSNLRYLIDAFGLWNCDNPLQVNSGKQISATFVDQEGNPLPSGPIYLADQSSNALKKYEAADLKTFKFDPRSRNILWMVLPDFRLAVFLPEDFQQIDPNANSHTFRMKILDRQFHSVEELNASLSLEQKKMQL